MIIGILLVIIGMVTLGGGLGDADYYGGNSPYDSGYASFGGDYYTYSVNNAAETTSATNAVNSNLREISDLIKNIFGWLMMIVGAMSVCGFGIVYSGCVSEEQMTESLSQTNEVIEEYAISEEQDDEETELQTNEEVTQEAVEEETVNAE